MLATPLTFGEGFIFARRYRIVRLIGTGGMGAVYEAIQLETQRRRALKVMLPHVVQSAASRERFRREARLAAQIDSAFVVDVLDAGIEETTGLPYMVMELLNGEDLGRRSKQGPLPASDVTAWLYQVALALDRSHAAGVVHRDLKPENLFLVELDDGRHQIKVLDFGIAKLLEDGGASITTTGTLGTPAYMAPEQLADGGSVTFASDVFALGMVAYTLLVGHSYWSEEAERGNIFSLAASVRQGAWEAPTVRALRFDVSLPTTFDDWFARATAPEPQDRFPSASEAVAALAVALSQPAPVLPPRTSRYITPRETQPAKAAGARLEEVRRLDAPTLVADSADAGPVVLKAMASGPTTSRVSLTWRPRPITIAAPLAALLILSVAASWLVRKGGPAGPPPGKQAVTATIIPASRTKVAPSSHPPTEALPKPASPQPISDQREQPRPPPGPRLQPSLPRQVTSPRPLPWGRVGGSSAPRPASNRRESPSPAWLYTRE
jgi:serine/threonine-protein kinase